MEKKSVRRGAHQCRVTRIYSPGDTMKRRRVTVDKVYIRVSIQGNDYYLTANNAERESNIRHHIR